MRRRSSLTATFALVSLVAMVVLGVTLVTGVAQVLRQQALDDSVRTATAYADSGLRNRVTSAEWTKESLKDATLAGLSRDLKPDTTLLTIRLWAKSGRSLFDTSL